jgi:2-dehydro-3-deoxyphosphogluconate aldolase / (4S)-4-hydroxy-2-oxoglutarate aldolase
MTTGVEQLRRAGVLAVLRAPSVEGAMHAAQALVDGGITGIEVTYSTPDVPRVLALLAERHGDSVLLGAGTLTRPGQAAAAVNAGARFLVSPGLDDDVVRAMLATGVPALAGALTPTEIMRAVRLGVPAVKIFPGSLVGPDYLGALRGPFPDVAMMPTGGVSVENLSSWIAQGAIAVGVGGELAPPRAIANGRWDEIRTRAQRFVEALGDARADQ